jgi:glycosyltransferase involved in cell wall biosynthesis
MQSDIQISVIISTYSRAEDLHLTLEGFQKLHIPPGFGWELLVVDNASTDHTPAVCKAYAAKLPLRYLFEARQGQNYAHNRAVAEARAKLLLFTDDDVDTDPDWLLEIFTASTRRSDASIFGGKVISRWQTPPPKWFVENQDMLRSNPRVDLGEDEIVFSKPDAPRLIGANLAFRKSVFQEERFCEALGPRGDGSRSGQVGPGELDLERRLMARGHKGLYVPGAVVYHRDPPHRMTEKYIRHWYAQGGRVRVTQGEIPRSHLWFRAPRYLWREAVSNSLKYLACRPFGPSRIWLDAECRMALAWGSICEFRKQAPPIQSFPS